MNSYFANFLMMVFDYSFKSCNITDCLMVDYAKCQSVRVLEYQIFLSLIQNWIHRHHKFVSSNEECNYSYELRYQVMYLEIQSSRSKQFYSKMISFFFAVLYFAYAERIGYWSSSRFKQPLEIQISVLFARQNFTFLCFDLQKIFQSKVCQPCHAGSIDKIVPCSFARSCSTSHIIFSFLPVFEILHSLTYLDC